MSHGFYSQTPHQQYPSQPYAQPQAPYPNLDRTSQAYSAPGHSPQAAPPTGYFPSHGRSASEFAGTPQPYTQPPYPAQGYAPYGQQPPAAQQPPFSPFTQPPASSYGASASGYQHPVTAQPPQPSPSPPRVQHQHSHSVPAAYPPTSSAFSSYGSPTQPSHTQQGSFAGRPSTTPATNGYNQFGARPDSMPPPARSATAASSYAQQSEFGQSYRGTASTLPRNSFVPTAFGSRARSASPLPPTAYGDLARAPTVASTKSLDSGLVNKRPLPSAPGIGAMGSLSSVRERTSMYEVDTRVKDFAYPGRESPTKAFGASSPTKSGYIPYKREETSALPSYPSTSTIAGTSSKPTYAAQPSVNPRTAPFDPFGASNTAQLASSPPKTFTSSFGRNDSPTRALPPPASAPAPARSWAQEKASLSKPKSDLPLVTPLPLTAPALPARRPAPPFAPSYKRPDPVLPPYSPPKPAPAALADDRDWESKEREWTRERDRAEEAIARAREAGRSFLQEQVGVPEVRSEAAAIAEEYLARRALEAAKTKPAPERRSQTVDSYTSAPPTRRFEPPERRPNDTWGSPSRKDRWGEPKGDYTDYRPKQSQSPIRRAESPERANHVERRGGYASPERRASPANSSGPLPKSRSQKAFPSDGDYVQHRTRETFRSNGASPTRHQVQASEPTRPTRNDLYDSQDDYDAREEYDARPSLQGMSRRERDDEEFHERRSPERAPPQSRGNPGTSHVQTRTEPRPMPREPPRASPPRSQYSSPERQQPRPQSRSQPQQQPPQQPQRPMSSASPATSPRAPAASQKPAMAPYQSMAMKIAAQALADETKVWPSEVPQLPRAPGRPETNARQEYEPPRTPVGTRPPVDDVSPPPSDLESEYDEPERQWTEPAPASPRREPATPVRREPATPTRREPATPTRREPATPTRRQPAPMRRDSVPVSPRREPAPASPRREPAPAPVRREPPAPASPKRQQPVRGPPQPRDIPQEDDYEYDMPRRQPSRNQPPPQRAMPQEDEYEYYDDEPPEQWREPAPKAKVADVAPKREPLRENTQPAFNRPRPPARSTSRDAPRREPSRDAALRRPVPPPPAAVPAPAPAPLARQPPPPPVARQPPPPPPPRSPSPVQMQGPTINFPDDDEYDNPPAPGLPTFSFDNVDEPAGPSINVTSEYDSEPSGPRIQVEEIPSISIIENSAPQIELPQEEDRRESPVRRGGGGGLRCAGCDGAIAGRIVSAMGVRWHPHCFKCDDCGTLLEHVSSYEHKGKAYCHLDYHDRFAPRCFHCKTPIVDERFIALDDPALGGQRYYHELHFFCAECGDPFLDPSASSAAPPAARGQVFGEGDGDDDVGFTVFNGHPYCEPCHVRLRMPRCGTSAKSGRAGPPGVGCGKPIREEAIEALGRKWHWKCFTCDSCKKPFEDPSFFQREDAAFCDPCYRILLKNEF